MCWWLWCCYEWHLALRVMDNGVEDGERGERGDAVDDASCGAMNWFTFFDKTPFPPQTGGFPT